MRILTRPTSWASSVRAARTLEQRRYRVCQVAILWISLTGPGKAPSARPWGMPMRGSDPADMSKLRAKARTFGAALTSCVTTWKPAPLI